MICRHVISDMASPSSEPESAGAGAAGPRASLQLVNFRLAGTLPYIAMYRCSCSTKALELFVNDFAGICLRQQRAQRFFQHYRTFRTRTVSRQLESVKQSDDASIPFDTAATKQPAATIPVPTSSNGRQEEHHGRDDGVEKEEDWHAEVELVAPVAHLEEASTVKDGTGEKVQAADDANTAAAGGNCAVESLANQHLQSAVKQEAEDPEAPVSIPDAAQKSKAENRKDRKQRRMEAGTYRAPAEARKKEEANESQVQTVLAKLDELEGPRLDRKQALEKFKKHQAAKADASGKKDSIFAKAASSKDRDSRWKSDKTTFTKEWKPKKDVWQVQKESLDRKFGEAGWQPRKRLSPDTMDGIRALHASNPAAYGSATLSEHFKISPEAIRRILKSKWRANDQEAEDRRIRWERRGAKKWQDMAEQGMRPPAKWRALGAGGEEGLKDERMPKRRRRRASDDHLSWDDVVGEGVQEEEGMGGSLAERIL